MNRGRDKQRIFSRENIFISIYLSREVANACDYCRERNADRRRRRLLEVQEKIQRDYSFEKEKDKPTVIPFNLSSSLSLCLASATMFSRIAFLETSPRGQETISLSFSPVDLCLFLSLYLFSSLCRFELYTVLRLVTLSRRPSSRLLRKPSITEIGRRI